MRRLQRVKDKVAAADADADRTRGLFFAVRSERALLRIGNREHEIEANEVHESSHFF